MRDYWLLKNDSADCSYLRISAYPKSNFLMAKQIMEGYSPPFKKGYIKNKPKVVKNCLTLNLLAPTTVGARINP